MQQPRMRNSLQGHRDSHRSLHESQRAAQQIIGGVDPSRNGIAATVTGPTKLKLYITLRKQVDSVETYKKLMLMIEDSGQVFDLKRRIEREFSELFPAEPPYVVAKIEDSQGFALSNQS